MNLAHIAPGLRELAVPMEDLIPDPANVRIHDARNLEAIRRSLHRFGQQKPIVVRLDGTILAGNGTYEAAKRLGWSHIAAHLTDLEGVDAAGFAIADNRTSELALWDISALVAQVGAMELDEADLGFSAGEIEHLLKVSTLTIPDDVPPPDPNDHWAGMPEYEHEDMRPLTSVTVHLRTPEDLAEFARLMGQSVTEKTRAIWFPRAVNVPMNDQRYVGPNG